MAGACGASSGCWTTSASTRAAAASSRSTSRATRPQQRHSPPPELMPLRDLARLLTLAGLWGASFAFMRVAVPAVGPLWLAFLRVALAFGALLAFAVARRNVPPLRERWRDYLVVGAVNSALPFALYCFAEQYVTASTAAILNATSPFFGAVVAALWLKDPLTLRQLVGMGLGLAGVVLLVGWQPEPLSGTTLVALLACLGAALC